MKKLIFISFILISAICNAQTESGKILLSGNTNGSFLYSDNGNGSTNVNFATAIGFFLSNDINLGLYGAIQSKFITNSNSTSNITIYEVAPFLRFYIPLKNSVLKPYFEFEGGISGNKSLKGSFISASMGFAIFLNHHVSFDPAITFLNSNWEGASKSTSIYGLNLGISVYLGKDKE